MAERVVLTDEQKDASEKLEAECKLLLLVSAEKFVQALKKNGFDSNYANAYASNALLLVATVFMFSSAGMPGGNDVMDEAKSVTEKLNEMLAKATEDAVNKIQSVGNN